MQRRLTQHAIPAAICGLVHPCASPCAGVHAQLSTYPRAYTRQGCVVSAPQAPWPGARLCACTTCRWHEGLGSWVLGWARGKHDRAELLTQPLHRTRRKSRAGPCGCKYRWGTSPPGRSSDPECWARVVQTAMSERISCQKRLLSIRCAACGRMCRKERVYKGSGYKAFQGETQRTTVE